jgi:hypothetical protein
MLKFSRSKVLLLSSVLNELRENDGDGDAETEQPRSDRASKLGVQTRLEEIKIKQ